MTTPAASDTPTNFLTEIVENDLENNVYGGRIQTRFPPEPSGYLHIGHAKAICISFGIAADYGGICALRFDDTNPEKEEQEYIDAIKRDIKWLGFDWGDRLHHASDYFEFLYDCAERLISAGKAYVDDLTAEQMREYRGTLTEPGRDSPSRNRDAAENLDLFRRMRAGDFEDGSRVLRAKVDMASPQMIMRDPVLYRIRRAVHPHTGDEWVIYPMYDFTHGLSDAHEGVTHSFCSLEFEDNRAIYDWLVEAIGFDEPPHQYEFSRLNLEYTITSKRYLNQLVTKGLVSGWDDPRMPTISGLRRRGYTAASLRDFCSRIGVTKSPNNVEMGVLEFSIREDLNTHSPRALAVLDPIKVVIENYPEGEVEYFDAANHPGNADMGTRKIPFSRELYIERDDFMEDPPKKYFRLGPGREVRFRYAYYLTCTDFEKDADGNITEIRCTYDPESRGGNTEDGRKVKGTIHWLSCEHARSATVRLYDRLFNVPHPKPNQDEDFTSLLNPDSLVTLGNAFVEESLANAAPESRFQFERLGYFVTDLNDHSESAPVFNRTVTLRDTWAKKS